MVGFLVYYVIRFIIYLAQRRWKATAVLLVILGWVAASAGMAFALFITAFAGLNGRSGTFYMLLGLFVSNAGLCRRRLGTALPNPALI